MHFSALTRCRQFTPRLSLCSSAPSPSHVPVAVLASPSLWEMLRSLIGTSPARYFDRLYCPTWSVYMPMRIHDAPLYRYFLHILINCRKLVHVVSPFVKVLWHYFWAPRAIGRLLLFYPAPWPDTAQNSKLYLRSCTAAELAELSIAYSLCTSSHLWAAVVVRVWLASGPSESFSIYIHKG